MDFKAWTFVGVVVAAVFTKAFDFLVKHIAQALIFGAVSWLGSLGLSRWLRKEKTNEVGPVVPGRASFSRKEMPVLQANSAASSDLIQRIPHLSSPGTNDS